jgi:hypothetical protein
MADRSLTFSPTVNVDVGLSTYWTVNNAQGTIDWSCPDDGVIVRLEPQDSNTCKITGLSGGMTIITMTERNSNWGGRKGISSGVMFVYSPDGTLWAAPAASFTEVDSDRAAQLAIPTFAQMDGKEAYYIPPDFTQSDANVTCYVINLDYIRQAEVWTVDSSSQAAKKSTK